MTSKDCDLRYISLGAGVQSTALYLLAARGEIGPKPDCAIFADTQAEPPWVYENLDRLEALHGDTIPIRRVTRGSLLEAIDRATTPGGGRFASVPFWVATPNGQGTTRRHCTREYKIDAVKAEARRLLGINPGEQVRDLRVEEWVGISLDESHRAKPSRITWISTRWPLLFDRPMRRGECLKFMDDIGYPKPRKSSCFFCPYHGDDEWVQLRENAPEMFKQACALDEKLRANGPMRGMRGEQFLHKSLVPLRNVKLDPGDTRTLSLFGNECEGMCGV